MCLECRAPLEAPLETPSAHALRVVFAITLDRKTAATCMGDDADKAVTLWPSTLYRILAVTALASPAVWNRCERRICETLGPYSSRFKHGPPAELAKLFMEGRDACSGLELAALLWELVRHPCGAVLGISCRLGAELETIAASRLGATLPAHASVRERVAAAPVRLQRTLG